MSGHMTKTFTARWEGLKVARDNSEKVLTLIWEHYPDLEVTVRRSGEISTELFDAPVGTWVLFDANGDCSVWTQDRVDSLLVRDACKLPGQVAR